MMPGAARAGNIIRLAARLPWPVTALAVCALFAVVGAAVVDDYGVSWDEFTQRKIALANARYIAGDATALHALPTPYDRYYGVAIELPLLGAEYVLGLDDFRSILLTRHLLTHLFYLAGGFCAALLVWRLFGSKWLSLLALLLFLLHPRLYAHSFFNSKDVPAASMFIIALYLTHRAWRKDTVGAFLLFGIGVGLLMNLRLVGAMLFPAVLALRVLDLAAPPRRPGHIMLTGGVFLLAGAGTMYAMTPYLWANPLALADAYGVFAQFPHGIPQLFQGQLFRPQELPAHYLPTWIAITTPPGTLLLSAIGAAAVCYWAIRRPGDLLRRQRLRFGALCLSCLVGPILAIIALDVTLYSGWRQMYLLYAPLCLLALFGARWAADWGIARWGRWLQIGICGLAALGLTGIVVPMAQLHPHQNVYFNFLVDRKTPEYLRTQYDMAYWGTTTYEALKRLLEQYPDTNIRFNAYGGNDWRNWSILPAADRQRIHPTNIVSSDFQINFGHEHAHTGRLWNPVRPLVISRQVYHNTLWSVEANTGPATDAARAAWLRTYQSVTVAAPDARSNFDLYRDGNKLHYVKEPCVASDLAANFFLHIYPAAPTDRQQSGFENRDFAFYAFGNIHDGKCLATIALPDYAVSRIRTGQYFANQPNLWEVQIGATIDAARAAWLQNYQSITAAPPAARRYFDLYRAGNKLHYVKEPCVASDLAATFFLHIYPAEPADLPAASRPAGLENRDFQFRRVGGNLHDGKCLATVELPDYAIARIHTGQYAPDQPRLWEVTLPAEP